MGTKHGRNVLQLYIKGKKIGDEDEELEKEEQIQEVIFSPTNLISAVKR
jgi:hypothetical protein